MHEVHDAVLGAEDFRLAAVRKRAVSFDTAVGETRLMDASAAARGGGVGVLTLCKCALISLAPRETLERFIETARKMTSCELLRVTPEDV